MDLIELVVLISSLIKKFRHPRFLARFIVFVLVSVITANFLLIGWITSDDKTILIILGLLVLSYILITIKAAQKPIGLSKMKLDKLEKTIDQGLSWDREDLFSKKPLYFIDFAEIYNYNLLHARYLRERNNFKKAYEIYNSIDERKLFEAEKKKVYQEKAYVLYHLGSMAKADNFLELTKNDNDPQYLMLKAMLSEIAGNLKSASDYLQKALNSIPDNTENIQKAMIYNNYGRIRQIEGNYLDAVNYYRLAVGIAKKFKNKQLLHLLCQNLIHSYFLQGNYEKSRVCLEEYEGLIDAKVANDLIELYNLKVELARQKLDISSLRKHMLDGYLELRDRVEGVKKLCFDVTILRTMFNARANAEKVLEEINTNIDQYFSMQMPDKYLALKEIIMALKELNPSRFQRYVLLYKKIYSYMEKVALSDLENCIDSLEGYEVSQRCAMEKERVGVLREYIRPYNFQNIYKHLVDIKDIFRKNGMFMDVITTDLDIAGECFAQENYEGRHIKSQPLKKMRGHATLAENDLAKINNHPRINEFSLRLACYFLVLGDKDKAKHYYEKFEAGDISIANYAVWLQRYYCHLKLVFG